jgi:hypothetical protein
MTQPVQPLGYATPIPGSPDVDHLRLLSLFHYILGGILTAFGCIPIIHVVIGILIVTGSLSGRNSPPVAMGFLFIGMGLLFILLIAGIGLCLIFSGRCIARRRHYMFSFIVAAICCLQMPLGTLLGVFTIIVLSRPTVKAMYGR